jgi:hypothetical protein
MTTLNSVDEEAEVVALLVLEPWFRACRDGEGPR